jgi:hypothetical protein
VVKGRFFCLSVGIDEDERVPTGHRFPVPESIGVPDPLNLLGNIDGECLIFIAERDRLDVVSNGTLRLCRGRRNQQAKKQKRLERSGEPPAANRQPPII